MQGMKLRKLSAFIAAPMAVPALAATGDGSTDWLPWVVVGAIALFVIGIVLRMVLSARFPKGYRQWAEQRRESFASKNETWDREDEEFRR